MLDNRETNDSSLYYLICQMDDVQQQISNVDQTLQANASSGKRPRNSTITANGMTRQATRQSVNASEVRK